MKTTKLLIILIVYILEVTSQSIDLSAFLCTFVNCGKDQKCVTGKCQKQQPRTNKNSSQSDPCEGVVCLSAQKCINGHCKSLIDLFLNDPCSICPAGMKCVNKQCILDIDLCKYKTCGQKETCKQGNCYQNMLICKQSSDCQQGYKCQKQICVQMQNESQSNINKGCADECMENEKCKNGECILNDQNTKNEVDSDETDSNVTDSNETDSNVTDSNETASNETDSNGMNTQIDSCSTVKCQQNFTCSFGQCISSSLFSIKNCFLSPCGQRETCYFGSCVQNKIDDICNAKCNKQTQVCINNKCFSIDADIKTFCDGISCSKNESCAFGECIQSKYQSLCNNKSCQTNQFCYIGFCFANTVRKNAQACKNVQCENGSLCINGKCQYLLNVMQGLCSDIKCKSQQVCMYGECVDKKMKQNCDALKCSPNSICLYGTCFPIFSSFQKLFYYENSTNSNESKPGQTNNQTKNFTGIDLCKNTQCKPNQTCILGVCFNFSSYSSSNSSSNTSSNTSSNCNPTCKENQKCQNKICLPIDPCQGKKCDNGKICSKGQCIENPIPSLLKGCSSDKDCANGGLCIMGICINLSIPFK